MAQDYEDHDEELPRRASEIGPDDLIAALRGLAGFDANRYLRMQGYQLQMVDTFLSNMEEDGLRHQLDDDPPREPRMLLAALSPMWIYAALRVAADVAPTLRESDPAGRSWRT